MSSIGATGRCSEDPTHFAIISTVDHYLYTKDGRTVHANGNPILDSDPASFLVLQGAYAPDDGHAFYFDQVIADADLSTFRPLEEGEPRQLSRPERRLRMLRR